MKNLLVTGGAGYIGSHMVLMLTQMGFKVTVVDDLSNGHRDHVIGAEFHQINIADKQGLSALFSNTQFEAVLHFASSILVGESMVEPDKYYQNNVANSLVLLDTMLSHGVKNLVFSSTAAIFGEPLYTPIDTKHPKIPLNTYGRSKNMLEQILADYDSAYGLKSVCLRYFNAAGADPESRIGESHDPETHLIPLLLQVASGKRQSIQVFGRDYDTADGTCIRDYIHVTDLCSAHVLALDHLKTHQASAQFNLGNGRGYSVQEVISAVEHVTGKNLNVIDAPRRKGDPAVLIADSGEAEKVLSWQQKYADLHTIIEHAWAWEQQQT